MREPTPPGVRHGICSRRARAGRHRGVPHRLRDRAVVLRHLAVPLGYLVYKSGFLPRVLGVLLILDGVAELIWFFQALLLPDHPEIRTPGTFVSLLAEVGLMLWLLIVGVAESEAPDPAQQQ
ncbi:MAG: DUF4386 domain-containing protein [Micrococcales bacterium]|nr:DUF4386 domain-containing protein [Micrococcales bacterium]